MHTNQGFHRDQGFTAIEVLVATTLTLVVLTLSVQAFIGGLRANEAVELMSGTNENLQVAGTLMTDDITKAGQDLPTGGTTIPSGAGSQPISRPGKAGAVFPAGPVLYAITPGNNDGPLVSAPNPGNPALEIKTDIINVVYVDRTIPTPLGDAILPLTHTVGGADEADIESDGSRLTVQYDPANPDVAKRGVQINSNEKNRIMRGDLLLLTNTNGTVIVEVTADPDPTNAQVVELDASSDILNFNQPAAAVGGIMTLKGGAAKWPPTQARRLSLVTYYIDSTDKQLPMLMRQVNARAPSAIALGVENIQFAYSLLVAGVFTDVVTPLSPRTPNDIRKVSVYVGARSEFKSKATNDYMRNSLLTQANVRSLGFFDIYR